MEELLILHLRSVSTGDFQEALTALLGKDAPNLLPPVMTRPTAEWQGEYDAWHKRPPPPRRTARRGLDHDAVSGSSEMVARGIAALRRGKSSGQFYNHTI